jgi:hypothetical protein
MSLFGLRISHTIDASGGPGLLAPGWATRGGGFITESPVTPNSSKRWDHHGHHRARLDALDSSTGLSGHPSIPHLLLSCVESLSER